MAPRKKQSEPAPSVAQLAQLIGRRATWGATPDVKVEVEVKDVRSQYGHLLYLVTPVAGSGSTWVRATSAKLIERDIA
jgi:hypothetical protein